MKDVNIQLKGRYASGGSYIGGLCGFALGNALKGGILTFAISMGIGAALGYLIGYFFGWIFAKIPIINQILFFFEKKQIEKEAKAQQRQKEVLEQKLPICPKCKRQFSPQMIVCTHCNIPLKNTSD